MFKGIFDRREFLKKSALAAIFAGATSLGLESMLSGCASFDPKKDWTKVPKEKFDIKAFDEWYRRNKLYNKVNPNLKWPQAGGHYPTFKACLGSSIGATPGIDYKVPWGEVMVAVAPGKLNNVHELHTGRAGGLMVTINHTEDGFFKSYYAHLYKSYIDNDDWGAEIKRGQPIGSVRQHHNYAKLLFSTRSWIDPDNLGPNQSYMAYMSDLNKDFEETPEEEIQKKAQNQEHIREQFFSHLSLKNKHAVHFHESRFRAPSVWSEVEEFRYLETLYNLKPDLFPSLGNDEFQAMKKEFYDNQPIVLTLPFVKGGMKR